MTLRQVNLAFAIETLVVLVALVALAGCVSVRVQRESESAEARAIRAARIEQNAAMAAGDIEKSATYWTEDVTIRRALGQDVHGRAAYRQILVPTASRDSSLVYQRDAAKVEVSGHFPLAFETGTWAGHMGGAAGPAVIGGSYSAQWVKRDGRWLIRSEVFVALTCSGVGCSYQAVP